MTDQEKKLKKAEYMDRFLSLREERTMLIASLRDVGSALSKVGNVMSFSPESTKLLPGGQGISLPVDENGLSADIKFADLESIKKDRVRLEEVLRELSRVEDCLRGIGYAELVDNLRP